MTSTPGPGWARYLRAKSRSACDTPGMSTLSRTLRRWDPIRAAAGGVGVVCLGTLAAYAVGAGTSEPTIEGVAAAVGFFAIAITGFLYAWRLGAGGTLE